MPSRVKNRRRAFRAARGLLCVLLPGALCCALATTAAAAPPLFESDSDRFVPAVSFFTDMVGYGGEATTDAPTFTVLGTPIDPQPSSSGTDTILNPYLGLSFELATPGLADLPGEPRFFVRSDVAWTWPIARDVAKRESPRAGTFEPFSDPTVDAAIGGQGAVLGSQLAPWQFGAGAGVAFVFELSQRRFRVKPSVEYLRESVDLSGQVKEAVDVAANLNPDEFGRPHGPGQYVFYDQLDFSSSETFHGLGGGLEIESDMGRSGPLIMTLYFATKIYSVLNDTRIAVTRTQPRIDGGRNEYTGFLAGTSQADYVYEHDDLIYRAGVGVRFRFSPD